MLSSGSEWQKEKENKRSLDLTEKEIEDFRKAKAHRFVHGLHGSNDDTLC